MDVAVGVGVGVGVTVGAGVGVGVGVGVPAATLMVPIIPQQKPWVVQKYLMVPGLLKVT